MIMIIIDTPCKTLKMHVYIRKGVIRFFFIHLLYQEDIMTMPIK